MSKATPTHLKDLIPDPENRRKHNPRNLGMVADALRSVGAARSIVIDEDNVVLAGNGVSEAAAEAGIERVQVVDVDGSTLVAVRRRGLSVEQKRALALYDNRTAELAEWDADQLQADVDAGVDLQPWFSERELAGIVGTTVPFAPTESVEESAQKGLKYLQFIVTTDQATLIERVIEAEYATGVDGPSPHKGGNALAAILGRI